tara:strand:- start:356498 stop:358243 length:1746 start_codon:yes stop_codon:yes gene_type:complete
MLLLIGIGWVTNVPSSVAQEDATARDIIESDKVAREIAEEKSRTDPESAGALSTPLNSMLTLRAALRDNDFDVAGEFLDRRYLPDELEQYTDKQLLTALAYVWGQQNIVDLGDISDNPQGNLNDGLPSYRDQVGSVTISSGTIPIFLQHVPDGAGNKVWKLSNATVAQIPVMWEELGYSPVAIYLSQHLPDVQFMGMDNWQLIATIVFFIIAWPIASILSYLMMRLALLIPNRFPLGIKRFFKWPMKFFLFVVIARILIGQLGLSLTARILMDSSGVDYIAWTVLLLGFMSLVRDYQIRKMQHAGNTHYVALLKPFTTILKIIVVTIIALVWAQSAGYDMSTILAGLGVGSLAVALAAQKTLENVIGAVTLYTARPVSAGDFCRFGDVTGTVEEIGLRSTLIRTLNRTMVVIPNSVFSSLEIENYSHRDRIRYFREFKLQLASSEQLRYILAQLRRLFLAHPRVLQETVSVRFENIVDANAVLRLEAGVDTTDFQQFLAVAEDLNLRTIDIVHEAGAVFSGPGQLLQLRELKDTSPEQLAHIEERLKEWRDNKQLPFPNPDADEIAALKGTLDYPPHGSAS